MSRASVEEGELASSDAKRMTSVEESEDQNQVPPLTLGVHIDGDEMETIIDEGGGSIYTEKLKRVKKPVIKLHVHIHDKVFQVGCGNGKQELKWLAMTAAQRYVNLAKPCGRMRQREPMRRARVGVKSFQPTLLKTPRLSPRADPLWPYDFPHPRTKIRDLLRNGDHVEVQLDTTGNMDHMVTGFQSYAFHNSTSKMERRRPEELSLQKHQIEKIKHREEKRLHIARSLFGEVIDLSTDETMRKFSEEWGTVKIPSYAKTKQERAQLEQVIREHYVTICTAFAFYGGLGDIAKAEQSMNMFNQGAHAEAEVEEEDDDETISMSEFEQFCSKTGILDGYRVSHKIIMQIFKIVNQKLETHGEGGGMFKVEGDAQFDRGEFLEAIILLAHYKYDKEFDGKIVTQTHNLMVNLVQPHVERLRPSDFRLHMAEGVVCNLLLDNIGTFRTVFEMYLDEKTNNEMNSRTFKTFAVHVGFMEGTRALDKKFVEHIFMESQNERFPAETLASFMQEMVLVEFMEGACRLAEAYWPNSVGKLDVKVDMLIDLLQRLIAKVEAEGVETDDER
jgi:hypothetical protein|eukprot:Stramenopile-MAST_4_protein_2160